MVRLKNFSLQKPIHFPNLKTCMGRIYNSEKWHVWEKPDIWWNHKSKAHGGCWCKGTHTYLYTATALGKSRVANSTLVHRYEADRAPGQSGDDGVNKISTSPCVGQDRTRTIQQVSKRIAAWATSHWWEADNGMKIQSMYSKTIIVADLTTFIFHFRYLSTFFMLWISTWRYPITNFTYYYK